MNLNIAKPDRAVSIFSPDCNHLDRNDAAGFARRGGSAAEMSLSPVGKAGRTGSRGREPRLPNRRTSPVGAATRRIGLALFLATLGFSAGAQSSLDLTWNRSASTGVSGYKIYYGSISGIYTQVINAGNTTNATLTGLASGSTVFIVATAYTAGGLESDYSSEISYAIGARPGSGLSFPADSGALTPPFVALGGIVSQPVETGLLGSGRAGYFFTIFNPGPYTVSALVNAADGGQNSLYVNIDGEPTDPLMIWDIPVTAGFQDRTALWRDGSPQKIFNLAAGDHQLIIRGREANVQFQTVTISPAVASLDISLSPAKQVVLTGMGKIGQSYSLLASPNLATWTTLNSLIVDATGAFGFTDPTSATLPARFYALRETGVAVGMAANVVGYYNVVAPAHHKVLLANQLHTTNDTLVGVIRSPGPGATFFKYNGAYSGFTFDDIDLAWTGNTSLAPGEGGFFVSPVNTTLTFVGTVPQGSLTNTLPVGVRSIRASIVPQVGQVSTDLKVPGQPGDNLYQYRGAFSGYNFDDVDLVWEPKEPTNLLGEAFFYVKAVGNGSNLWIRNFTVQ